MPEFLQMLWERIIICQNFLMAGPLVGATCAILSVYVVLRRMALISEGVSHAGFGGVAVAIMVGFFVPVLEGGAWQLFITGLFCLGTAMLIGYVTRRRRVTEDSAIGIFLVASMALGQILIKIRTSLEAPGDRQLGFQVPSVETLLFGHFASVIRADVIVAAAALLVVLGIVGALYYQFLYTTLDEEMARINGVNTRLVNTLLLLMVSLVIVVCVRMVGFLMITALMIIPGATATMISRRFGGVMLAAILIGTLGTSAATWVAMVPPFARYPSGSLVVLVLFAIFAAVWLLRHFIKPRPLASGSADRAPARRDVHPAAHHHPGHQ